MREKKMAKVGDMDESTHVGACLSLHRRHVTYAHTCGRARVLLRAGEVEGIAAPRPVPTGLRLWCLRAAAASRRRGIYG